MCGLSIGLRAKCIVDLWGCDFYNWPGMKIETIGILISLHPFNERDCVARIMTPDFGVLVGMMRGTLVAKKNRPMIGQYGNVSWGARLDSQLGVFHWEAEKNLGASIMMNPKTLMCMNAAFEILQNLLPEREAYPILYSETQALLNKLGQGDTAAYLDWEIILLRELGYALDLSCCAGCGAVNGLKYVSPRTGRAVCGTCGAPFADKLYKMPIDLMVTGRFLESICVAQGVQMPPMRKMLKID